MKQPNPIPGNKPFESVQVGQLSTDSTPTMAFADPEE